MKYSESSIQRVFVIRLEHNEPFPKAVEEFVKEKRVKRGIVLFLGGVNSGSNIVVGPEETDGVPAVPVLKELIGAHETLGVGTIFPDEAGNPVLHAHASFGRMDEVKTGCTRPGIKTWEVLEVIVIELAGECGTRVKEEPHGFTLLNPEK